jgi:5-oxoprolinase (ATP-hydrolysing) subunit C
MMRTVELSVTDTGWLTTFQDLGRRDSERLGVPTGGAADQRSATVANLLVGNPADAVLLESMAGEVALVPARDVLVAVTGAPAVVTVGGAHADSWTPLIVPAGSEIRVAGAPFGMRSYLAVAGALRAERFLGSAAPDARMGFAQKVARGSRILVDSPFDGFARTGFPTELFRLPVPRTDLADGPWTIDVVDAPASTTVRGIRELIAESTYTVTDRSNHVGLRLNGPVLHPEDDTEIVSHGVPIGALEVPHADELIVLGRYRSLTAGYPIVGFATQTSLAVLGQAGPGRELRFRWVDRDEAVRSRLAEDLALRALRDAVGSAFEALGATPLFAVL